MPAYQDITERKVVEYVSLTKWDIAPMVEDYEIEITRVFRMKNGNLNRYTRKYTGLKNYARVSALMGDVVLKRTVVSYFPD